MKTLLTFLLFAISTLVFSQEEFKAPRLQKQPIDNSGCFAYMPAGEFSIEKSYSPDSAVVYSGEIVEGKFHYAVIVVKFNGVTLDNESDKYEMITSYMDFLQSSFEVVEAAGYGKGHSMESDETAVGVIDYWKDSEGNYWEVKGWVNATALGVMMIYGPEDYPNYTIQSLYLNGFRFK